MNILYISHAYLKKETFIGIRNKIEGQIEGIRLLNNIVHYTFMIENNFYYNNGINEELIYQFKNKYEMISRKYMKLLKFIEKNNIECVYIRYSIIDMFFINFVKKLSNNKIRVYLEIPTFPYDNELGYKGKKIDKFFRQFIYKYITGIVVSSCKTGKIFGVESIFIDNCVNSKNIKFLNRNFNNSTINMIAVSYIRKTNGYDRIIEGLKDYYKKGGQRVININFIGNGEEVQSLNDLVKQYNLEGKVKFIGSKTGNELNYYFKNADLAIGSLADHRDNIFSKAPLKSREYCARGIPFISAVEDPGFANSEEFVLKFPANDEKIDIGKVIEFYDNLKGRNISEKMRHYAIEEFDWVKQYSKIRSFNNINLK